MALHGFTRGGHKISKDIILDLIAEVLVYRKCLESDEHNGYQRDQRQNRRIGKRCCGSLTPVGHKLSRDKRKKIHDPLALVYDFVKHSPWHKSLSRSER